MRLTSRRKREAKANVEEGERVQVARERSSSQLRDGNEAWVSSLLDGGRILTRHSRIERTAKKRLAYGEREYRVW